MNKKPPKSVVQTGYVLIQARNALRENDYLEYSADIALGYTSMAIVCAKQAETDLVSENDNAFRMFFGEGQKLLQEARIALKAGQNDLALYTLGHAHTALRKQYRRLGYRELTNDDFLEFGVGGGGGR